MRLSHWLRMRNKRDIVHYLIITIFLFAGLTYWRTGKFSGDGIYTKEGIVLKTYSLSFPIFPLDRDGQYSYCFKNVGASNLAYHQSLYVRSQREMEFWRLSTSVEIEIRKSFLPIFAVGGPLNAHYESMWKTKKVRYPKNHEWWGRFRYGDANVDSGVVPFVADRHPIQQSEMTYTTSIVIPLERRTGYCIGITVATAESENPGLTGQLVLTSGWK